MSKFEKEKFKYYVDIIDIVKEAVIESDFSDEEITLFKYFLVDNFYYPVIIDDYNFPINDKMSFIEAFIYQTPLCYIHSINWDAFNDSFYEFKQGMKNYVGVVFIFRKGKLLRKTIPEVFKTFVEIIETLKFENEKPIKVFLN